MSICNNPLYPNRHKDADIYTNTERVKVEWSFIFEMTKNHAHMVYQKETAMPAETT